jgi:sec-independent protein translocase protein TatB
VGFSFGELVFIALLAIIVIGPKDLPKILRTAGRTIGQIKRVVSDVRRETGLDEVLRGNFQDLERLADHIERIDGPKKRDDQLELPNVRLDAERREREYPRIGADNYNLLSEDAPVYGDLNSSLGQPPAAKFSTLPPSFPPPISNLGPIAALGPLSPMASIPPAPMIEGVVAQIDASGLKTTELGTIDFEEVQEAAKAEAARVAEAAKSAEASPKTKGPPPPPPRPKVPGARPT